MKEVQMDQGLSVALEQLEERDDEVRFTITDFELAEEAEGQPLTGREWLVTLIEAGWNKSRTRYWPATVLEAHVADGMFGGLKSFDNHLPTEDYLRGKGGNRSVRDLLGFFVNPTWDKAAQSVRAKFVVVEQWLRDKLLAAREANRLGDLVGLSVASFVQEHTGEADGHRGHVVDKIVRLFSADVVSEPGAGGRPVAALSAADEEGNMTLEELKAALGQVFGDQAFVTAAFGPAM